MQGKLNKLIAVAEDVSGAQNIDLDITNNDKMAIQVVYGASLAGNLELQVSLDGLNWDSITASIQALNVLGGSHTWNITDEHSKYLRIVLPAGIADATVYFAGIIFAME